MCRNLSYRSIFAAAGALVTLASAVSAAVPTLVPGTFTPDRFGGVPAGTLQVVAVYDGTVPGAGSPPVTMTIHLWNPLAVGSDPVCYNLAISPIPHFSTAILCQEYTLNAYTPTGKVDITGVIPNGGVDGVAYGMYWVDASGNRTMLRSRKSPAGNAGSPDFIGGWPLAFSEAQYDTLEIAGGAPATAAYNDFVARRQAQMTIAGAQLVGNGSYGTSSDTGVLPGDVNGDFCVDLSDLAIILANFGLCVCP